jgi:hypothetical protein
MARTDGADVADMGNFFKGSAEIVERCAVSDIDGTAALQTQVVDVLRETEHTVELDCEGRPSCDGFSEILKNGYRTLPPPESHCVRNLAARNQNSFPNLRPGRLHWGRLSDVIQGRVSDQITDVGNHPVLAGFDKPVLIELGDVGVHDVDLFGNHLQQRAQLITAIRIAQLIDRRK